jgi:hypothetical protein
MTNVYTGQTATAITYVERYNTPYRMIITDTSGRVLGVYVDLFVSDATLSLFASTGGMNAINILMGVTGTCDFDNSSKVLTCSYSDSSGQLSEVDFTVIEGKMYGYETICNSTSTASSDTFTCDLSLTNSTSGFRYTMIGKLISSPSKDWLIAMGYIDTPVVGAWGYPGIMLALVIILAVGIMLAMVHPVVCVIGTSFAVLATYWIGLLASVSIVQGSVLTGIVIALTALIVWKMK